MIVFNRRLAGELKKHASKERPNEACGILAGHLRNSVASAKGSRSCLRKSKKIVEKIYTCRNINGRPEARYTIDGREMLQTLRDIEDRKLELLGFYHSHPFAMASPSGVDEERAAWPEHSYVIVSDNIRSWLWDEKKFVEEEVCYD